MSKRTGRYLYTVPPAECIEIFMRVFLQEQPEEVRAGKIHDVKLTLIHQIADEHSLSPHDVFCLLACSQSDFVKWKHTAYDQYLHLFDMKPPGRYVYPWKDVAKGMPGFCYP